MEPLFFLTHLLSFLTAFGQLGNNNNGSISEDTLYDSKKIITFLNGPLKDSLAFVEKQGKFGIIDSTGQVVVPLIYDKIDVRFNINIHAGSSIREEYLYQLRYSNELFYDYWGMGNEDEEVYAILLEQELNDPESFSKLYSRFWSNPIFSAKNGRNLVKF